MSEHATERLLTDVPFASFDLEPSLLKGIEEAGFRHCTGIQAQALPKMLAGQDVQGQAQTGTGKTAAFLLAAMNWLLRRAPAKTHTPGSPRAIILAPTRELAVQIHRDAETLGRHTGLRMGLVYGGEGYEQQRKMLTAGVDILIGTPGRLIDYFKSRVFDLKGVQVAVLDEADRMFDLGFIRDIRYLLRRMPPPDKRLNLLFSATLSLRVTELAYEHMNNPTVVNANPERVTVKGVTQVLYHVGSDEKIALLIGLLRQMGAERTIVFVNTKRTAERLCAYLEANDFAAGLLTGDVPQRKRLSMLERFTRGELPILVATDVAARGLHIPNVSHVFNYDLPQDAEDYVHRIGRTARVGERGEAISFACEEYVFSLPDIEAFVGQKLPTRQVTEALLVKPTRPARGKRSPQGAERRRGRASPGRGRRPARQRTAGKQEKTRRDS